MVGLVIVSHSQEVARGVKEMATQMLTGKVRISASGGTRDGRLGMDVDDIHRAIREVNNPDGVLVLFDIGSGLMAVEMAIERLTEEERKHVSIADTPLVEGAILAATQASLGSSLEDVKRVAEEARELEKC
jgi:dihydroxyacetone kinase phosphotransfer subunit